MGEERLTVQVAPQDVHREGEKIVVPGMVFREVRMDVWNVYECQEFRKRGLMKTTTTRIVTDPIDKDVPGRDPTLTVASIKDIDRRPIGPQWEPATFGLGQCPPLTWQLGATDSPPAASGKVALDSSGRFSLELKGADVRAAAQLPDPIVTLKLSFDGPVTAGQRQVRSLDLQVERTLFVKAMMNEP
jgi:hypothetical protein